MLRESWDIYWYVLIRLPAIMVVELDLTIKNGIIIGPVDIVWYDWDIMGIVV